MKTRLALKASFLHVFFVAVASSIPTYVWSFSCGNIVAPATATSSSGEYSITHAKNNELIQFTLSQHSNPVASFQYPFLLPSYQKLLSDGTYAALESTSCYGDRLSAHIYAVDKEGSLLFSVESRNLLEDDYLEQLGRSSYALGAKRPWFSSVEFVGESLEDAKLVARLSNYDQLEVTLNTGKGRYIHVADLKDDADGWSARANWYHSLRQIEEEAFHNLQALNLAPEKHYVRYRLMQGYSQASKYEKAQELAEEALRLWPLTAESFTEVDPFSESARTVGEPLFYQLWLAKLQQEIGNIDKAISLLNEILTHNPNEWEANELRATLEIDEENRGQVLEHLQSVFKQNMSYSGKPEFKGSYRIGDFYRSYSYWLSKHKFFREAEEVLLARTSAVDSEANRPSYGFDIVGDLKALAENAKKQGDKQAALNYLIQATNHSSWDHYLRTEIAWMYLRGDGVDIDQAEALKWFINAANTDGSRADNFPSCYLSYLTGEANAKSWCEKGVESEEANSAFWLALMILRENSSEGVPAGLFTQIEALLNFSRENNYPDYGHSERVDFDIFELSDEIVEFIPYLQNMAQRGSLAASYHLGRLYDAGVGVEQDNKEAILWFKKAAEAGDLDAQYQLGIVLLRSNASEAIAWLESAARAGHAWAAYELGEVYYKGIGVAQDVGAMESWLLLSDQLMQEEYALLEPLSLGYLSYVVRRKTSAMARLEEYRSAIEESVSVD